MDTTIKHLDARGLFGFVRLDLRRRQPHCQREDVWLLSRAEHIWRFGVQDRRGVEPSKQSRPVYVTVAESGSGKRLTSAAAWSPTDDSDPTVENSYFAPTHETAPLKGHCFSHGCADCRCCQRVRAKY